MISWHGCKAPDSACTWSKDNEDPSSLGYTPVPCGHTTWHQGTGCVAPPGFSPEPPFARAFLYPWVFCHPWHIHRHRPHRCYIGCVRSRYNGRPSFRWVGHRVSSRRGISPYDILFLAPSGSGSGGCCRFA